MASTARAYALVSRSANKPSGNSGEPGGILRRQLVGERGVSVCPGPAVDFADDPAELRAFHGPPAGELAFLAAMPDKPLAEVTPADHARLNEAAPPMIGRRLAEAKASAVPAILIALAAAITLAGCNSTTQSGSVGATLSGQGVTVTVERLDNHPPYSANAFNGPVPGDRLIGARVKVCSTNGGAINEYAFTLVENTGAETHASAGDRNYFSQAFQALNTGCSQGWILFQVPKQTSVTEIQFAFNNTGGSPGSGGAPEAHVNFSWKV